MSSRAVPCPPRRPDGDDTSTILPVLYNFLIHDVAGTIVAGANDAARYLDLPHAEQT
ncbi:hypothetical protein [Streptomyces sp. NPDC058401]|uniref:hypothetical protein n=1 Tax=Streptomyces sp. NPDC058401 TaxID=3346480 RepID=UPI00365CF519